MGETEYGAHWRLGGALMVVGLALVALVGAAQVADDQPLVFWLIPSLIVVFGFYLATAPGTWFWLWRERRHSAEMGPPYSAQRSRQSNERELPETAPPQMMTRRPPGKRGLSIAITEEKAFRPTPGSLVLLARIAVTNDSSVVLTVFPRDEIRMSGKYWFSRAPITNGDDALEKEVEEANRDVDNRKDETDVPTEVRLDVGGSVEYWIVAGPFDRSHGEPEYLVDVEDEFGHLYELTRLAIAP